MKTLKQLLLIITVQEFITHQKTGLSLHLSKKLL